MPSRKEYFNYISCQLKGCDGVTIRPMMGEYIIYYKDKIIGGIYDDRLLVKNVPSAKEFIGGCTLQTPYSGAREMILITETDSSDYLKGLFEAMYGELPLPKEKHKK